MKKKYENPQIEVIKLESKDIIVMSTEDTGDVDFGDLTGKNVVE